MSKIEWTDKTWNPVTGCTKISPGCKNCYAERMSKRLKGRFGYPADDPFSVTFHRDKLDEPFQWKKPWRIFVCSMGDLFHEDVTAKIVAHVWAVMMLATQHTFIVLTKRPERMLQFFQSRITADLCAKYSQEISAKFALKPGPVTYNALKEIKERGEGNIPKNIWLGVTAENQEMADKRIPILMEIPAAVRLVSVEPMLGPISFRWAKWAPFNRYKNNHLNGLRMLDWVICGGESGHGARPMSPYWVRSLRDQCVVAGVPFFFKQWGEWIPKIGFPKAHKGKIAETCLLANVGRGQYTTLRKVGKKAAGRLIDGRVWDEMPK